MINHKEKYDQYLNKIEARLLQVASVDKPSSLYEPFRYLVGGGGKRIRPVLAMISCGAVGGNPWQALDIAAAVEILHNFTLAHDDIMDDSPMRRGRPTLHKKWDSATAILTGDVMVGYVYKLLPYANEHERSKNLFSAFTDALIEVCEGQAYDMEFNKRKDVSIEEYMLMIGKKTAYMLETSAAVGGLAGNGNDEEIECLRKYGYSLGLAFQLQDDLLDLISDNKVLGKNIGEDIREGKKTLMILKAKEKAISTEDIELLNKFYVGNGLSAEYVPAMCEMLERLGVFAEVRAEVDRLFAEAKSSLNKLQDNDFTAMLRWLPDSLNKREY